MVERRMESTQPKWGPEHDKIVEEYKKARQEGKVKEFVVVPRG